MQDGNTPIFVKPMVVSIFSPILFLFGCKSPLIHCRWVIVYIQRLWFSNHFEHTRD